MTPQPNEEAKAVSIPSLCDLLRREHYPKLAENVREFFEEQRRQTESLTAERDRLAHELRVERTDYEIMKADRDRLAGEVERLKEDSEQGVKDYLSLQDERDRLFVQLEAVKGERDEAEECSRQWSDLAHAMLRELRVDYAPGAKSELDGPAMIRTIKAQRDALAAQVRELRENLGEVAYQSPDSSMASRCYFCDSVFGQPHKSDCILSTLPDAKEEPQQLATEGQPSVCQTCLGKRVLNWAVGGQYMPRACPDCEPTSNPEGAGEKCPVCRGAGEVGVGAFGSVTCQDCDGTGRRPIQEGGGE